MSVDVNNLASVTAAIAQFQTATVAVAEPPPFAPEQDRGPLTEEMAIALVRLWAKDNDDEDEPSKQRTFEEMVSNLEDAAETRDSMIPESRFAEIVKQYAPNAPHVNDTPTRVTKEESIHIPP